MSRWAILVIIASLAVPQFHNPISTMLPANISPLISLGVNFTWAPTSILVGNSVNFTGNVVGGTAPYTYSWDFGDGRTGSGSPIQHTYAAPGNYTATLTVRDTGSNQGSMSHTITVLPWPIVRDNWVVNWNMTGNDGINIWNVTYKGMLVVRDARVPAILVRYVHNLCLFYDEIGPDDLNLTRGLLRYENSPDTTNPWFQVHAYYNLSGYDYGQAWRFYPDGRWDAIFFIGHLGCSFDHIYEPRFRFDLAMDQPTINDQTDIMSQYTQHGTWQNYLWEENSTDNGSRDGTNNNAQWRFGKAGKYYYILPQITRSDTDIPLAPSKIYVLRAHPGEIEIYHNENYNPVENPGRWINGELVYRQHSVFWWIPDFWDHGPPNNRAPSTITLSFFPSGF